VFAKYDEKWAELFFYNDRLKRVDPSSERFFVDAKNYKYDEPVEIIKNSLKEEQKISPENRQDASNITNESKQKVSNKLKNRLD
jgi:hypothetical protein